MARDVSRERERALDAALDLYRGGAFAQIVDKGPGINGAKFATDAVLATATALFRWLIGGVTFTLTRGPVVRQDTGLPTGTVPGGPVSQIHDDEQYTLSVEVDSAKGNVIGDDPTTEADNLTWTVEGDEGIVSVEVSDDTRTAVVKAVDVGSVVVRIELNGTDLAVTEAVDVVAGPAALLKVTAGVPEKQPVV